MDVREQAGDAGASSCEQRPSSCTSARIEAVRSRTDPHWPLRTQLKAAVESRDKLMKKHSAAMEGVQSLAAQLQAKQSVSEELAIGLRDKAQLVLQLQERMRVEELAELPCVLPSCPRRHVCGAVGGGVGNRGARLSGGVIQGLNGGLPGRSHETHSRRYIRLGRRRAVATHEPGFDCLWGGVRLWCFDRAAVSRWQCTVLHADAGTVLHTDTGKPRRCEREGEGCRGQSQAAHEGARSVGDAAFSLPSRGGRALSGSPRHTQSRNSHEGGQHSHRESGGGRLSQGSLVSPKGGHAECPDIRVREWIWCPSVEFMNLQDVQDDEQAHEFVTYTDGSAMMTEKWSREAVCAGRELSNPSLLGSGTVVVVWESVSTDSSRKHRYGRTWCYKTDQQCRTAHGVAGGIDVESDVSRTGQGQGLWCSSADSCSRCVAPWLPLSWDIGTRTRAF